MPGWRLRSAIDLHENVPIDTMIITATSAATDIASRPFVGYEQSIHKDPVRFQVSLLAADPSDTTATQPYLPGLVPPVVAFDCRSAGADTGGRRLLGHCRCRSQGRVVRVRRHCLCDGDRRRPPPRLLCSWSLWCAIMASSTSLPPPFS